MCSPSPASLYRGERVHDPFADIRFKYVERNRAAAQHSVMECLDVEILAEPEFAAFAQFQNFQLADFVSQSLARPGNVAIDLIYDVMIEWVMSLASLYPVGAVSLLSV